MAVDEKQPSALMKRQEQVKRWEDSDTNLEPVFPKRRKTAVQFQDGCVFLAACSSGDTAEVDKLLRSERSANINTANVDGLTALHQACIDDNLEMVEFLVEHGADINACDNEGWTPLHATASCAFLDIARYLINHNANVAAVNNDGELPIDIAENEEMENLLQEEMDREGIDADAARCAEEQRMLEDANLWLSNKTIKEIQHPKTGASALHVAAAKGYIKVMNILLQAGIDTNVEDYDGWTPLHAAVHWSQEEACKILVENMCDMMHKNKAGHTVFDLAEKNMMNLLEELKETQASIKDVQGKSTDIILSPAHGAKRSSTVTRMSVDQKHNVLQRTSEEERVSLASLHPEKTDNKIPNNNSKVTDGKVAEDSQTEHKNDKTNQVSQQSQMTGTTAVNTPITSSMSRLTNVGSTVPVVELRRSTSVTASTTSDELRRSSVGTFTPSVILRRPASVATSMPGVELRKPTSVTIPTTDIKLRRPDMAKIDGIKTDLPALTTAISARTEIIKDTTLPSISTIITTSTTSTTYTGTTPALYSRTPHIVLKGDKSHDSTTAGQDPSAKKHITSLSSNRDLVSRFICVPTRLPTENLQDRLAQVRVSSAGSSTSTTVTASPTIRTTTDSDTKSTDSNTSDQPYTGYRSPFASRSNNYIPFYMQRQMREAQSGTNSLGNSDDKPASHDSVHLRDHASDSGISTTTSSSTPILSPASASPTNTTAATNSAFRRSYEPPKRDEETETQRKARAKHARQTRRSTQGVSLEDIEKAEESLSRNKTSLNTSTTPVQVSSTPNSAIAKDTISVGNEEPSKTARIPTVSIASTVSSTAAGSDPGSKEDRSVTSGYRRWTAEDKTDSLDASSIRGSYRRSRLDRDLSSSTGTSDVTVAYVPRSQRTSVLPSGDNTTTTSSGQSVQQSSQLLTTRQSDLSSPRLQDESKKDEPSSTQEKKEEKKESTSLRARRQRRERRSTGLGLDTEDGETVLDDKSEEDGKEDNLDSVRYKRDYSNSEHTTSSTEVSKSSGYLNADYKKRYDETKTENERLKNELDVAKKELVEAKTELDKVNRQKDNSRNSEREKRILERRLTEMEDELKKLESFQADSIRLKDENSALIRVISKLSK